MEQSLRSYNMISLNEKDFENFKKVQHAFDMYYEGHIDEFDVPIKLLGLEKYSTAYFISVRHLGKIDFNNENHQNILRLSLYVRDNSKSCKEFSEENAVLFLKLSEADDENENSALQIEQEMLKNFSNMAYGGTMVPSFFASVPALGLGMFLGEKSGNIVFREGIMKDQLLRLNSNVFTYESVNSILDMRLAPEAKTFLQKKIYQHFNDEILKLTNTQQKQQASQQNLETQCISLRKQQDELQKKFENIPSNHYKNSDRNQRTTQEPLLSKKLIHNARQIDLSQYPNVKNAINNDLIGMKAGIERNKHASVVPPFLPEAHVLGAETHLDPADIPIYKFYRGVQAGKLFTLPLERFLNPNLAVNSQGLKNELHAIREKIVNGVENGQIDGVEKALENEVGGLIKEVNVCSIDGRAALGNVAKSPIAKTSQEVIPASVIEQSAPVSQLLESNLQAANMVAKLLGKTELAKGIATVGSNVVTIARAFEAIKVVGAVGSAISLANAAAILNPYLMAAIAAYSIFSYFTESKQPDPILEGFKALSNQIDQLHQNMMQGFQHISGQIDDLRKSMMHCFTSLENKVADLNQAIEKLNNKIYLFELRTQSYLSYLDVKMERYHASLVDIIQDNVIADIRIKFFNIISHCENAVNITDTFDNDFTTLYSIIECDANRQVVTHAIESNNKDSGKNENAMTWANCSVGHVQEFLKKRFDKIYALGVSNPIIWYWSAILIIELLHRYTSENDANRLYLGPSQKENIQTVITKGNSIQQLVKDITDPHIITNLIEDYRNAIKAIMNCINQKIEQYNEENIKKFMDVLTKQQSDYEAEQPLQNIKFSKKNRKKAAKRYAEQYNTHQSNAKKSLSTRATTLGLNKLNIGLFDEEKRHLLNTSLECIIHPQPGTGMKLPLMMRENQQGLSVWVRAAEQLGLGSIKYYYQLEQINAKDCAVIITCVLKTKESLFLLGEKRINHGDAINEKYYPEPRLWLAWEGGQYARRIEKHKKSKKDKEEEYLSSQSMPMMPLSKKHEKVAHSSPHIQNTPMATTVSLSNQDNMLETLSELVSRAWCDQRKKTNDDIKKSLQSDDSLFQAIGALDTSFYLLKTACLLGYSKFYDTRYFQLFFHSDILKNKNDILNFLNSYQGKNQDYLPKKLQATLNSLENFQINLARISHGQNLMVGNSAIDEELKSLTRLVKKAQDRPQKRPLPNKSKTMPFHDADNTSTFFVTKLIDKKYSFIERLLTEDRGRPPANKPGSNGFTFAENMIIHDDEHMRSFYTQVLKNKLGEKYVPTTPAGFIIHDIIENQIEYIKDVKASILEDDTFATIRLVDENNYTPLDAILAANSEELYQLCKQQLKKAWEKVHGPLSPAENHADQSELEEEQLPKKRCFSNLKSTFLFFGNQPEALHHSTFARNAQQTTSNHEKLTQQEEKLLSESISKWGLQVAINQSLQENTDERLKKVAKSFGFGCDNVNADGNCFFHAVAAQLKLPLQHQEIKGKALQYIIDHIDSYIHFSEKERNEFINGLLDSEWADHIFIHATAKALNITIAIVKSNGADPKIVNKGSNKRTIFLGQEVVTIGNIERGRHFQSLKKIDNAKPDKSIDECISKEPEDRFESTSTSTSVIAASRLA